MQGGSYAEGKKAFTNKEAIAKSIMDATWGILQTLTKYKAKEEGKVVVYI
ncbi:MAG: hypothetical protein WBA93_01750 [Microcoleaceae cyanobacterium]